MPHVLVVDDDRAVREALVGLLVRRGYSVAAATNGQVALDYLRECAADVVVLDLTMPVMEGREFLAAHRRDPALSSIPVVVLSGGAMADVDSATECLSKPLEADQLVRALSRCLAVSLPPCASESAAPADATVRDASARNSALLGASLDSHVSGAAGADADGAPEAGVRKLPRSSTG
jgi:CheY-like chemotaxis protein